MRLLLATLMFAALLGAPAQAAVREASAGAFLLRNEAVTPATPEQAWQALIRVGAWWSADHTYSQDARNLRLEPRAGGCWCERWDGNSVEHMRVVLVLDHDGARTLRMRGGLGPLQEMGVNAVMSFTITPQSGGAKIAIEYRVSGDPGLHLDGIAPGVDTVLMEQFDRLVRYTGERARN